MSIFLSYVSDESPGHFFPWMIQQWVSEGKVINRYQEFVYPFCQGFHGMERYDHKAQVPCNVTTAHLLFVGSKSNPAPWCYKSFKACTMYLTPAHVKPGDIATNCLVHVVLALDDVVFAAGSVATAAYYISDGQCHYVSWSVWVDDGISMRYA